MQAPQSSALTSSNIDNRRRWASLRPRVIRGAAAIAAVCAALLLFAPSEASAQTVTVTAPDPNASESGLTTAVFRISRTGNTSASLTINCSLSGAAVRTTDYTTNPTTACAPTLTLPSGSASLDVFVTPVNDSNPEGDEAAVLTINASSGSSSNYNVGSPNSATITISDDDLIVSASSTGTARESGPAAATFRISRPAGSPAAALAVNCSLSAGSPPAARNTDYTTTPAAACSPSVTIPASANFVDVSIVPVADTNVEGDEIVILTLTTGAGYTLGSNTTASLVIEDDDVPLLSLSNGGTVPQSLSPAGQVRFTIGLPATTSTSGSAISGRVDVAFSNGSRDPNMVFQNQLLSVPFTIPANSRTGQFLDPNGQPFAGMPAGSVGFQPGTNAGNITFTLTSLGTTHTVATRIDPSKPVITSVTAERTSNGMTVSVVGFSTARNIASASFTFGGKNLSPREVLVPESGPLTQFVVYYGRTDAAALNAGSTFRLTVPFTITEGRPADFTSVTVVLRNTLADSEGVSDPFQISY